MSTNALIIKKLEAIAEILPIPLYWVNTAHVVLGVNKLTVQGMGASCLNEVLGKTPYDLYPEDLAKHIVEHNEKVIKEEVPLSQEEAIQDLQTRRIRYYTAYKSPLRDEHGKVIGLVGSLIEIKEKEAEALKLKTLKEFNILRCLELLAPSFPIPMYWNDLSSVVLGANERTLSAVGISRIDEILGKTPYEMYPSEIAERIVKHNEEVIRIGQILSQEEIIKDIATGRMKYYSAFKSPLRDEDGKIIGTLGTSIEITAEKEAELLRLENARQQVALQEQEKFRVIAERVAHDIRSPLASLLMIVKACQAIPERERIALRGAAVSIDDIANNLLNNYRKEETDQAAKIAQNDAILVSPLILQLLAEKKYQYQNLTVKFDHHFSQVGNFAWIQIDPIALKRMLSNSLNNAVDALNQQEGRITLHLDADHEQVTITVEDNGKGMRPELVQKILNQGAVTEGKPNGHGIGLTQARETLQNHQGRWAIDSQVGVGTKILFTFPRAQAQNWIAESIQLNNDDTVVILDDDSSIHLAWDTRFDRILKEFPNLTVKHFEEGQETVDFINGLTPEKKQKIFLLTDYELLKQELNGLDVIKKTHIYRSILVTSHYINKAVREEAAGTGTRILPKQLASDIPINHAQTHPDQHAQKTGAGSKKVVSVFIDDDQALLDSFTFFAANKKIDTYHDPQHFLDNSMHYEKQTKIFIDYCFSNFDKNGIQLAGKLHDLGFTQLYLLSGMSFSNKPVPDYLTVISKTDLNRLKSVLNGG